MTPRENELREDVRLLVSAMKEAGVPAKLIESIRRKCLKSPRRQTGRVDRRTNRQLRWNLAEDHPDFSTQVDSHLVFLRLLLDVLRMRGSPRVEDLPNELSVKHFGSSLPDETAADPLTDEVFVYADILDDVVTNPTHGYSRFHIGHQDPGVQPKHTPTNIRWQLKESNDFQGTMHVRVARLALAINNLMENPHQGAVEEIVDGLAALCSDLGLRLER